MAWLQDWHSGLGPAMQALVQATWQASVLVMLVLAVQMMFGRWLNARWRYALWSVVVLRLMLPVTPGSVVSVFNLFRGEAEAVVVAELPVAPVAPPAGVEIEAIDLSGWEPVASAAGEQPSEPVDPWRMADIVLVAWLVGVLLVLGLLLLINTVLAVRLRQHASVTDERLLALLESCKREMGLRQNVRLLVIPKLASPALAGMFQPKLLVPTALVDEMPEHELRFIFLHELAHMKKHDIAMNWLLILLAAVHWFNPLVWFAFARLRADRELARDALVLRATGTDASQAYGQTIIRVLEQLTRPRLANPAIAGIGDGMGQLKRRIRMIALSPKRRPALTVVGVMLLATLAVIGLTDAAEPGDETRDATAQVDVKDESPNLWEEILVGTADARSAIRTIEAEYQTRDTRDPSVSVGLSDEHSIQGVSQTRRETTYIAAGDQIYQKTVQEHIGTGAVTTIWFEVASDGARVEKRRSNGSQYIAVGDPDDIPPYVGPTPWQLFSLLEPHNLKTRVDEGKLRIISEELTERDGVPVYQITFESPDTGHRLVIAYDPDRAYLPIWSLDTGPHGVLMQEIVIQEITEIKDIAGKAHYIPVKGQIRHSPGTGVFTTDMTLNPDTLKVNEPIDQAVFSLSKRYPDCQIVEVQKPTPAERAASAIGVPHLAVNFEAGKSAFETGDSITIRKIIGTQDTIGVGGTYTISGVYTLQSREGAKLGAFTTTAEPLDEGPGLPGQTMRIGRGSGVFELTMTMKHEGRPHVSFYPSGGGQSFGGVYWGPATEGEADTSIQTYNMRDLLASGLYPEDMPSQERPRRSKMIDDIQSAIAETVGQYTEWSVNGGSQSTIQQVGDTLVIKTTSANHAAIKRLLVELAGKGPADSEAAEAGAIRVYDLRSLLASDPAEKGLPEFDRPLLYQKVGKISHVIGATIGDFNEWSINGGDRSMIAAVGDKFIIKTSPENHEAINRLLGQLREQIQTNGSGEDAEEVGSWFATESPAVKRNLRQMMNVGMALRLYSKKHEGYLTSNLGTTLPFIDRYAEWTDDDRRVATFHEKVRMYLSPSKQKSVAFPDEPTAEWISEHTSYVCLCGDGMRLSDISQDNSMTTVLLHEKLDEREVDHGVGLVFFDGHGETVVLDKAERLIEESKRVIEAAQRPAGVPEPVLPGSLE